MTRGITVEVAPMYVEEQSRPYKGQYVFIYGVRILNETDKNFRLIKRKWFIKEGGAIEKIIEGEGVGGETPYLPPTSEYTYSSFCTISSPNGSMRGTYTFIDDRGNELEVEIPIFYLRLQDTAQNQHFLYRPIQ